MIIATVGIINAYNLIDRIDGLLSGLGMSSIALMSFFLVEMGEIPVALAGITWCGGLLAFSWYLPQHIIWYCWEAFYLAI
jgi:UDP-N-acetylmuramyl pentapeptide phosphotransferase/UDP-N-acetylglucosamine-1-phosphate transferase